MKRRRHRPSRRKVVLIAVWVVLLAVDAEAGRGKTKTKTAILAASQVNSVTTTKNKSILPDSSDKTGQLSNKNLTLTSSHALKNHLLQNYDSSLRPVLNHNDSINIKVDFTYRQVLDLDEKNQILKSLVWLRMSWVDQYLTWHPDEFNGIEEIELAHNLIWRPDIVVNEEIGIRDYSPRLQKVKIFSDGTVRYHEPTAFETTCSIDTAFFPFDVQVCYITLVSWSEPVLKIDLTSGRSSEKLFEDTKTYFINTGEWKLVGMAVNKFAKDYGQLLSTLAVNHTEEIEMLEESELFNTNRSSHSLPPISDESRSKKIQQAHERIHKTVFPMSAEDLTTYTTLGNKSVKRSMFSEIQFTIVVRRNSSLYMQSMLFPSILLTTVALLGFYLPPDSGERIGLQITILLTFMVFLLAVGEMFPASTGPYLGVYFVLCMGLLGINLAMTVIVLHLHFKPVINRNPEIERKLKKKNQMRLKAKQIKYACSCMPSGKEGMESFDEMLQKPRKLETSVVPRRLRRFLQFCNSYWSLNEYNARWLYDITDDEKSKKDTKSISDEEFSSADDESVASSFYGHRETIESSDLKLENETFTKIIPPVNFEALSTAATTNHLKVPTSRQKRSKSFSCMPGIGADEIIQPPTQPEESKKSSKQEQTLDPIGLSLLSHVNFGNMKKSDKNGTRRSSNWKHSISAISELNNGNQYQSKRGDPSIYKRNSRSSDTGENVGILRHKVMGAISDLKSYIKKSEKRTKQKRKTKKEKKDELKQKRKEEAQERQDMEQEEWKSVARAIDMMCFRVYVILIVVAHAGLFAVALETWFTDHDLTFLDHVV